MKKIICLLVVLLTANCAFPASKNGMLVTDHKMSKQVGDKIYVKESKGGSITLPFWMSKIPNDNFTDAVKESLLDSKSFAALSDNWGDAWGLDMEIKSLEQPMFGFDYTVTTVIKYNLYLKGKKVYTTTIRASGTSIMSDAFTGIARIRIANERSARSNIEKFIAELAKFSN
jgi:hypothetical protein